MIDDLRASGECKINLTIKINFVSSEDNDESQPMHSESDNTETMIDNYTSEIINELFSSLLIRSQLRLKHQSRMSISLLIVLIKCITNVIE